MLLAFPSSSVVSETEEFIGAEGRLRSCSSSEQISSPLVTTVAAVDQGGTRSRPVARSQAYAEMVFFLHCNQALIPKDVPELSQQEASEVIPKRLRRPFVASRDSLDLGGGLGAAGVVGEAEV